MTEVLELIGNTPVVETHGLNTGLCRLFLKLENRNPGGSIKDRIALSMVQDAEARGVLSPGGRIVEATAGNTGLGLALVCAQKDYRLTLVVPDKMSREKINHLRALGAEVILTRSDVNKGHPEYYQDMALSIARSTGAWYADQFSNPANPRAHETTTGPEIWEQMQHDLDAVVAGVGSGGTLGGLTHFFARQAPHVAMVVADPEGSVITPYIRTGCLPERAGAWLVEGIGEDFIPANADFTMVKAAYTIPDKEAFLCARELLRTNGILAGSSSGTLLAAALRYCREQTSPQRVLSLVCDDGSKYLSKTFSNLWMAEQGFCSRTHFGDLRDLITMDKNFLAALTPSDTLQNAYARMKMYDISQLPVMDNGKVVGIIDEWDLLCALENDPAALKLACRERMSSRLKVIKPAEPESKVLGLLKDGLVAIIADENDFYGIVTKMDFINYLRSKS